MIKKTCRIGLVDMFCDRRKIIFTHPPKCGGTSFESYLKFNNDKRYKHASLIEHLCTIKSLGLDDKQFTKISVIRNPWERVASHFFHIKKRQYFFPDYENKIDDSSFFLFIKNMQNGTLPNVSKNCTFFMYDQNHKFDIDIVIKYENYIDDFISCLNKIGIKINRFEIPHEKKCAFPYNYKEMYCSSTKKIVEEIFKEDIELFKYKF